MRGRGWHRLSAASSSLVCCNSPRPNIGAAQPQKATLCCTRRYARATRWLCAGLPTLHAAPTAGLPCQRGTKTCRNAAQECSDGCQPVVSNPPTTQSRAAAQEIDFASDATGSTSAFPARALHSALSTDLQHQLRGQIFLWNSATESATLTPRCNLPAPAL